MSVHRPLPPLAVSMLFEPTRLAPVCLQDAYQVLLAPPGCPARARSAVPALAAPAPRSPAEQPETEGSKP